MTTTDDLFRMIENCGLPIQDHYTPRQVAKILDCSPGFIYKEIDSKAIKFKKTVSGRYKININSIYMYYCRKNNKIPLSSAKCALDDAKDDCASNLKKKHAELCNTYESANHLILYVSDAADFLGIDNSTLYRHMQAGHIAYEIRDGKKCIRGSEILRFFVERM